MLPQVRIYDVESLEDVGAKYGLPFTLRTYNHRRAIKHRLAKMRERMAKQGVEDPTRLEGDEFGEDESAVALLTRKVGGAGAQIIYAAGRPDRRA